MWEKYKIFQIRKKENLIRTKLLNRSYNMKPFVIDQFVNKDDAQKLIMFKNIYVEKRTFYGWCWMIQINDAKGHEVR